MYFFWCTKYLINAPLGELKKKKKILVKAFVGFRSIAIYCSIHSYRVDNMVNP